MRSPHHVELLLLSRGLLTLRPDASVVQEALHAATSQPQPTQSGRFGDRRGLDGLKADGSWLRQLGALAGDPFINAMRGICPLNPQLAFEQLLKRKEFREKWLPEGTHNGLSKKAVDKALLETPLVKGLVDTYHKLQGFKLRRQHLSLIAPHLSYDTIRQLFGVSRCMHSLNRTYSPLRPTPHTHAYIAGLVYVARLHAAGVGTDRAVPPRVTSYRIKPEQACRDAAARLQCCRGEGAKGESRCAGCPCCAACESSTACACSDRCRFPSPCRRCSNPHGTNRPSPHRCMVTISETLTFTSF